MSLLLVRHASAGERSVWDGADEERPLDERGRRQARALVDRLAGLRVERILTSPALRCLQTVAPLAAARELEPLLRPELSEQRQEVDGAALARSLAGRSVLICGHGGLERAALVDPPKWKKGAALVLDDQLRVVAIA